MPRRRANLPERKRLQTKNVLPNPKTRRSLEAGDRGRELGLEGGRVHAIDETIDVEAEHATTTGDEADMPAETMHGEMTVIVATTEIAGMTGIVATTAAVTTAAVEKAGEEIAGMTGPAIKTIVKNPLNLSKGAGNDPDRETKRTEKRVTRSLLGVREKERRNQMTTMKMTKRKRRNRKRRRTTRRRMMRMRTRRRRKKRRKTLRRLRPVRRLCRLTGSLRRRSPKSSEETGAPRGSC